MATPVSDALKVAVQKRGMRPFLLHKTVGRDAFNLAFSSGVGPLEPWAMQLTNTDSNELESQRQQRKKFVV